MIAGRRHPGECHPLHPTFAPFGAADLEDSIGARFLRQAERRPAAIAVRADGGPITYDALARAAGRVAAAIRDVTRDDRGPIGILIAHGAGALTAIVGTLVADRPYVPLDPLYPRDRLAFMVRDSGASAIVTDAANEALARDLAAGAQRPQVVTLDMLDDWPRGAGAAPAIDPDARAYILYTSGSTGQPKGVVQNHRNALFHVGSQTNNLRICEHDRVSLLTSLSFDASVTDLFGTLLNGATSVPIDVRRHGLAAARARLRNDGVTIYHSTPTLFRHLFEGLAEDDVFGSIRAIVLGGEKVTSRDLALARRHFAAACVLVNGYGATESSFALQHHFAADEPADGDVLSIGWPIDGVEIALLDDDGREQPAEGEIGIRSRHVAVEYWNRPDLTAAAFLPPAGTGAPRTYRTGDIGRRLPDGRYVCLGRKDHQVKVRGHRVELAEIESAMRRTRAVRDVAVIAVDDDEMDGTRLVAFVVAVEGAPRDAASIRRALTDELPAFMIPAAFVFLDALPQTPTGKIDTRALVARAPQTSHANVNRDDTAPTAIERSIAEAWHAVLGVDPAISRDLPFFEAGGHSLAMMRVHEILCERLRVDVPLVRLYEFPTIRSLGRFLEEPGFAADASRLAGDAGRQPL
jgi:amino acid adenylation domain-containing protein